MCHRPGFGTPAASWGRNLTLRYHKTWPPGYEKVLIPIVVEIVRARGIAPNGRLVRASRLSEVMLANLPPPTFR